MRYLVTGGLGYAGSWVARYLAQKGHTVFILSRSSHTPDIGVPYTLVQADLAEQTPEELAQRLPEGLDGCVHAASYNEQFHDNYAKSALQVNALGTRNLLSGLVLQAKSSMGMQPLPLVVYCSTFHVYGKTAGELDERTAPAPQNDYALTHYFAEQYCNFFTRTEGLPSIVIRMTNCYGAPVCQPFSKWYLLVNDFCRQAMRKGHITVNANPLTQRDFIWLGDVSDCVEQLLPRRDLTGQTFLLASGTPKMLKDIAFTVAAQAQSLLGKEIPVLFRTEESVVPHLQIKTSLTRKMLNMRFADHMEQEIAYTLQYLASTPE